MTAAASPHRSARPRWLVPLLVALVAGSALVSWLLLRDTPQASVPAVVATPETTALRLSVGNDPAALRVPKAKRAPAATPSVAAVAASTGNAAPASSAAAPVSRAPSSGSSSSSSGSGAAPEPAALEFGR